MGKGENKKNKTSTANPAGNNNGSPPIGLPQPLQLEEKKFLLAVERGDIGNVRRNEDIDFKFRRNIGDYGAQVSIKNGPNQLKATLTAPPKLKTPRILQKSNRYNHINVNCMDALGRRALTLAIDNENLEMVELLVIMGVDTKDALLHAINAEFVEAVELLLEHEELIYKEGELYSWQKVDINTATFPPDITPLILAAHKNNYEILKILLDRGAAVPVPHDIKCGCDECVRMSSEDSLRHSLSRVNTYKALSSPSLICLTSNDPILTTFELSWELRNLAFTEQECKSEYMELRRQCQKFAVDLLDQTRTSHELAVILNYDPEISTYKPGDRMSLRRLTEAINYKQKKFVAHSNIQQLLASIWYEGLPGFRRKTLMEKFLCIVQVAVLFPIYCLIYMAAPNCKTAVLLRKPFMKFLIHASSYLFFLFILILVSQRADDDVIRIFGTERMKQELSEEQLRQRGRGPTKLEILVVFYLFGFIWEEVQEIFTVGMHTYLRNMWNFIDFLRNSLYVSVICLRFFAYLQQANEIARDPAMAYVPREKWNDFDPQLIAEGLFAAANVFSALKLVHLFSINPHLGPLQISLGRMVIDIVKFFFIYSLVLFAFACGLNQLLWYFADLEKSKCYVLPDGEADWTGHADSCMKWRRFGNLFESSQSLFWASFGMVGLDDFELTGIKSYTRFWGLLMFGSYSVINVIVLLNLLIAMMSNSYAMIDEHSDTEWKFARTKLWMSYFEDSSTLPPPFNIMPSVKWLIRIFRKSSKEIDRKRSKKRQQNDQENIYENILRSLVWRYVAAQHRKFEDSPVTEDDINEVKSEISTMRYEMLEIFENSGMDVSSAIKKEKPCRAKRTKVWERRLMKGFQVMPIQGHYEEQCNENVNAIADMQEIKIEKAASRVEKETAKERFRRVAHAVAAQSATHKWNLVLQGTLKDSQIGRCNEESYKNLQNLGKAMEEARKLIQISSHPTNERESPIPIEFEDEKTTTLMELLSKISGDLQDTSIDTANKRARVAEVRKQSLAAERGGQITKKRQEKSAFENPHNLYGHQTDNTLSSKPASNKAKEEGQAELTLTVSALARQANKTLGSQQQSLKKTAPCPPQHQQKQSVHVPFAVELGKAGRRPGFAKPPPVYQNLPKNFDINVVDLDSQSLSYSMDNLSDISSVGRQSPAHRQRDLHQK